MTELVHNKNCRLSRTLNRLTSGLGLEHWAAKSTLDYQLVYNDIRCGKHTREPFSLNILHLSDIHIECIPDHGASLIELVKTLNFDFVVLTGDYKFSRCEPDATSIKLLAPLLNALKCEHGIYAVQGNHDTPEIMKLLGQHQVTVLDNRNKTIKVRGQHINVAGISDPHYWKTDDLSKALTSCNPEWPTILLAHSAEKADEAQDFLLDLYLCGHSHGGQICWFRNSPVLNNARCGRELISGPWTRKFFQGYTSRGVGTTGYPLRVQCPPEVIIHRLFS